MHEDEGIIFDREGRWKLPSDDVERQAVDALRGYAYQLHQTAAAWIRLKDDERLYVEVAEDYAQVVKPSGLAEGTLQTFQVKNREAGTITLTSPDVLDAIRHLYALQEANPGRHVRLTFLTTAEYGKEKKHPLTNGEAGIAEWSRAANGGDVTILRSALAARFVEEPLAHFIDSSTDDELRSRLLAPLQFVCGQAPWDSVEVSNQEELVKQRAKVDATEDDARKAYKDILYEVLRTVLKSPDRMLDRQMFLASFKGATGILVRLSSGHIQKFVERSLQAPRLKAAGSAKVKLAELYDPASGATLPNNKDVLSHLGRSVEIIYQDDINKALEKLRARQENPQMFFNESTRLRALADEKDREDRAATLLAYNSELAGKADRMIKANVEALACLIEQLKRLSASEEQVRSSLETFTSFAALHLIRVLKQGFDWVEGGSPRRWFEAYKFNSEPSYCMFDWVPNQSATGRGIFNYRYWVGARVGNERNYEYVMFPLARVLPLFKTDLKGDSGAFFEWVLPQLAHEKENVEKFPVEDWEPFLLQGASGTEWWSNVSGCPWPEIVDRIATAEL